MKRAIPIAAATLALVVGGCNDDGCADGQVRENGNCVPYGTSSGGANGAATGGASGSGAATQGGGPGKDAAFAEICATSADCGGKTNYCAMPPTEPPYCTASGCDADASICPTDWTCFNLGQFIPGEPFVCVKPLPPAGNGDFGAACNTNADCTGETNYCAISPTEPPYCSISGCDADASICPDTWQCFDVGQFAPGEPFICVKPPPAM